MRVTPLEIRQKTFEKAFRGLDKEEVEAYILSLSQEWERILDENKEYKIKLEASKKEVAKLRELESSLFRTLKTAEDTGNNMIGQAEKAAEIHLKESQIKAGSIVNEAEMKVKDKMEETDIRVRHAVEEMEDQLKTLGQTYRTLESYRDDLLANIKMLSNDMLEKADRMKNQIKPFDLEEKIMTARSLSTAFKLKNRNTVAKPDLSLETKTPIDHDVEVKKKPRDQPDDPSVGQPTKNKSFFNEIE